MRRIPHFGCIPLLALAVACGRMEGDSQDRQTEAAVEPAVVERAADHSGQGAESGEASTPAMADTPSEVMGDTEAAVSEERSRLGKVASGPGRVAPASEGDEPGMKNWLLIEFARAIEPADLDWLEENGLRVDTVMSATTVRGWLEDSAGGAVIGRDPRVASISAQMR